MKNIILTGFMGTGKTAVGKELSHLLDMKLIDVDTEIVKAEEKSINEIFKQFGEQRFREIETEILRKVCRKKNVIISTGGGVVLKQENIDMMKENGILICLTARPETILKRTSNNSDRPLLHVENPFEKIRELLDLRKPYYEKADMVVDTEDKTPLQVAEEIIETIKNKR